MFKEVVNKINNSINDERKAREQAEETLLSLLEDTCNKINAASLA